MLYMTLLKRKILRSLLCAIMFPMSICHPLCSRKYIFFCLYINIYYKLYSNINQNFNIKNLRTSHTHSHNVVAVRPSLIKNKKIIAQKCTSNIFSLLQSYLKWRVSIPLKDIAQIYARIYILFFIKKKN